MKNVNFLTRDQETKIKDSISKEYIIKYMLSEMRIYLVRTTYSSEKSGPRLSINTSFTALKV